jgi:hypothetical protein
LQIPKGFALGLVLVFGAFEGNSKSQISNSKKSWSHFGAWSMDFGAFGGKFQTSNSKFLKSWSHFGAWTLVLLSKFQKNLDPDIGVFNLVLFIISKYTA